MYKERYPLALYVYIKLQGILDIYQYALGTIELYGPTNFSSILDKALLYASSAVSQQEQHYYILLIITVRRETA